MDTRERDREAHNLTRESPSKRKGGIADRRHHRRHRRRRHHRRFHRHDRRCRRFHRRLGRRGRRRSLAPFTNMTRYLFRFDMEDDEKWKEG